MFTFTANSTHLNDCIMPEEVSIVTDSVQVAQASPKPLVISALSDSTLINDTSSRMQIPAWKDSVISPSTSYPLRHDGLLRPVSLASETFLVVSLFCILLLVNRVVKNGAKFFRRSFRTSFLWMSIVLLMRLCLDGAYFFCGPSTSY